MTIVGSRTGIRLGTRASALARWQAEWVARRLRERGLEVVLVPITTLGDRDVEGPISRFGGTGVFTKELQQALLEDRIDLAVHSLKDLPTDSVPGLALAAVPERGPVADALVGRIAASLEQLPAGAVVGTSSVRRRAQLLHVRPDLNFVALRGNVDTRLRKLEAGQCDVVVLAEAGLERLGLQGRISQRLAPEVVLPAVGQGALGLETRSDDPTSRAAAAMLDHPPTHAAILAERALLATLRGGCLAPIAAWARLDDQVLTLWARVVHPDGSHKVETARSAPPDQAQSLGRQVAEALLALGAGDLIQAARL